MSEPDNNLSTTTAAELRIAKAQAHRAPVDSQGKRIGGAAAFHYDEAGRLVDVQPSPPDAAA